MSSAPEAACVVTSWCWWYRLVHRCCAVAVVPLYCLCTVAVPPDRSERRAVAPLRGSLANDVMESTAPPVLYCFVLDITLVLHITLVVSTARFAPFICIWRCCCSMLGQYIADQLWITHMTCALSAAGSGMRVSCLWHSDFG